MIECSSRYCPKSASICKRCGAGANRETPDDIIERLTLEIQRLQLEVDRLSGLQFEYQDASS
jgi:hypothetical protein